MAIATPSHLKSVQELRGVAALLVLFYHLMDLQKQTTTPGTAEFALTQGIWERGGIGVDLFFVISGFIMVFVTRDLAPGLASARDFLVRRAQRIYPLWWVCASVMALYFLLAYGMPAAPDRIAGPSEAWVFLAKSYALWPLDVPPVLGVGWTLSHEMFFYLVFAGALLFARKFLPIILAVWLGLTALAVASGSLSWTSPIARLITNPMSAEFIFGAAVAGLYLRTGARRFAVWGVGIAASAFLLYAMLTNQVWARASDLNRTLVYGPAFGALLWAAVQGERRGIGLRGDWLQNIGNWSYALYLSHYIVLVFTRRIWRMGEGVLPDAFLNLVVSARDGVANNLISAGLNTALCLLVAWALYRWVETPLIDGFKQRRTRRINASA